MIDWTIKSHGTSERNFPTRLILLGLLICREHKLPFYFVCLWFEYWEMRG